MPIPTRSLLALSLLALASHGALAQKTYLHCGRLLDVRAGRLLSQQTIVVEKDRIVAVQAGYAAGGPQDKVINLENRTVLPGLIDCHVHLESVPSRGSAASRSRKRAGRAGLSARVLQAGLSCVVSW